MTYNVSSGTLSLYTTTGGLLADQAVLPLNINRGSTFASIILVPQEVKIPEVENIIIPMFEKSFLNVV